MREVAPKQLDYDKYTKGKFWPMLEDD